MEKHFLADLTEPLKAQRGKGSGTNVRKPWFNSYGDCIVYQAANEAVIADRVDELLTVYNSAVDNRPIGFQIKGVCGLINALGIDGISVGARVLADELKEVSLSLLLLTAYERQPATIARRQAYASALSQAASTIPLPTACGQ